jgi:hypothetical protein
MKRAIVVALVSAAVGITAGCGSSSSSPSASGITPPSSSAGNTPAQPPCSSLVGQTLTKEMENRSCRTPDGALQATADLKCKKGTMVAFGNIVGGYIGKPVHAGNYANWPGCLT